MTGLRPGQLADAAGVNPQTLRYYERRGLLAAPHRTLGGHRVYPPETVTRLRTIKAAQRLGFTLDEVCDLLSAAPHATLPTRTATKLTEIEAKIADLQLIRDTLHATLTAGCDNLLTCPTRPNCPLATTF
jgi:DNA-binding transcriptional MerR regulator